VRLLLDTHIWLWILQGDKALGRDIQEQIEAGQDKALVSAISLWEAVIKIGRGRLRVDVDLQFQTLESDLEFLTFAPWHASFVARLPSHHNDPFDRALVAQAASDGLRLLTADRQLARYSDIADVQLV
jgi:PIN domain nuclease of toxin-antitoxin system